MVHRDIEKRTPNAHFLSFGYDVESYSSSGHEWPHGLHYLKEMGGGMLGRMVLADKANKRRAGVGHLRRPRKLMVLILRFVMQW